MHALLGQRPDKAAIARLRLGVGGWASNHGNLAKFAGAAINDIRNAIYQRMRDITRKGGSKAYQYAVNGNNLGVDRRGSTMNAFIGVKVLTKLLVMGRVGVFVDAPPIPQAATLADSTGVTPYLYKYDIEDILSWTCSKPEEPSEFQAILLRDTVMQYDQAYFLPTVQVRRYRYLRINEAGRVSLQFYRPSGPAGRSIWPAQRRDRVGIGPHPVRDARHRQRSD